MPPALADVSGDVGFLVSRDTVNDVSYGLAIGVVVAIIVSCISGFACFVFLIVCIIRSHGRTKARRAAMVNQNNFLMANRQQQQPQPVYYGGYHGQPAPMMPSPVRAANAAHNPGMEAKGTTFA